MVCDIIDQGNDLMGILATLIQIHFDAHPSSEIAEKFRSLYASVLDFQKTMLGQLAPKFSFLVGRTRQYSSCQTLYVRTNRIQ